MQRGDVAEENVEYCLRYLRGHQHHGICLTESSVDTPRENPSVPPHTNGPPLHFINLHYKTTTGRDIITVSRLSSLPVGG